MVCDAYKPAAGLTGLSALLKGLEGDREHFRRKVLRTAPVVQPPDQVAKYAWIEIVVQARERLRIHRRRPPLHTNVCDVTGFASPLSRESCPCILPIYWKIGDISGEITRLIVTLPDVMLIAGSVVELLRVIGPVIVIV